MRERVTDLPAFEIPRLRNMARHAFPTLLEGTLVPVGLFWLMLRFVGVTGALVAGITWSYTAILYRLLTRRRISGLLLLGAATITARTVIAMATGSVIVYFLQPTLGTFLIGTVFLGSAAIGRPLAERLARDFCPVPPDTLSHPKMRRFFIRISLLWAFVQLANATVALWLLFSQSVGTFVLARSAVSGCLTVSAIAASTFWFRRYTARHGIEVVRARGRHGHSRPSATAFVSRPIPAPVPVPVRATVPVRR
jgi:hypothetical protein